MIRQDGYSNHIYKYVKKYMVVSSAIILQKIDRLYRHKLKQYLNL